MFFFKFQKHTLSLVFQFYAHVLWQDEHIPEEHPPLSILVSRQTLILK